MASKSWTFNLKQEALDYHRLPKAGKLYTGISKPTNTQRDLSLAYTPGVAEPVRAIVENPDNAYRFTTKGNLVAVISDGSAVLGLGHVGPLASKPVMEGKAVLFKQYANIDVFDIEIDAKSPQEFTDTVIRIAGTFGGVNLEDIKAPQCFDIENKLIECLNIPVFHDDQHGTAITIAAGLLNALELQHKKLSNVKIVCLGAGAAGIASMHLLIALGAKKDNIFMVDRQGVIHTQRQGLNSYKFVFANETKARTLHDVVNDSDVFIGVSGPNLFSVDMLKSMAERPIVFALSNPDPEIDPILALSTRKDLILATGRSDYENQINNVLCFPYIFRGALDIQARCINQEMIIAAVFAIKNIAKKSIPDIVKSAYVNIDNLAFGPKYILPKPMDPRLYEIVPAAVAKAAIETGVARKDYPEYYPPLD